MNTQFIKATERTTLEINSNWFPEQILTARETICSLMRGRIVFTTNSKEQVSSFQALDADLNIYDWNSWYENRAELISTGKYPLIKTQHRVIPVPTIIRIKTYYTNPNINKIKKGLPRLNDLLKAYDYTCMLTGVRYDPSEFNPREIFNRDHVFPRSKGGTNDSSNIVLSTIDANTKKGDTYPYYKEDGTILKAKTLTAPIFPNLNLYNVNIRPEWEGILFLKE